MKHLYGTVEQICKILKTDPNHGLSTPSAQKRLEVWGPNTFHFMDKRRGYMERVMYSIFGGWRFFAWIIVIFCILNAIRINLLDHTFQGDKSEKENKQQTLWISKCFMGIIILGAMREFLFGECIKNQNTKGSLIVDELNNFNRYWDRARVIRSRTVKYIRIDELVRGDLIEFKKNEIIPADIRIVENSDDLYMDAFLVTGEHDIQLKCTEENYEEIGKVSILDRGHVAFFPSFVKEGWGRGIVIRTGNDTGLAWLAGHMATSNCLNGTSYVCYSKEKYQSTRQPINGKDWINAANEARYITKLIRQASLFVAVFILGFITIGERSHKNANLNGTLFLVGFLIASAGLYMQVKQYAKQLLDDALL